jgi:peroxisomal coenzyme A diphosphatase NUDT7
MNKKKWFYRIKKAVQKSHHPEPPEKGFYQQTSVIALFSFTKILTLLFIQKADVPGYAWANQMAFPGGHKDEKDDSTLHTTFRELKEETAIPRNDIELIGTLGHFQTINNKDIEAFTGIWNKNGSINYDTNEISRVFHIPFEHLVKTHKEKGFHKDTPNIMQLTYPFEDVLIWGVTARILYHLIEVLIIDEH